MALSVQYQSVSDAPGSAAVSRRFRHNAVINSGRCGHEIGTPFAAGWCIASRNLRRKMDCRPPNSSAFSEYAIGPFDTEVRSSLASALVVRDLFSSPIFGLHLRRNPIVSSMG